MRRKRKAKKEKRPGWSLFSACLHAAAAIKSKNGTNQAFFLSFVRECMVTTPRVTSLRWFIQRLIALAGYGAWNWLLPTSVLWIRTNEQSLFVAVPREAASGENVVCSAQPDPCQGKNPNQT
jgi:hypothetical protein